MNAFSSRSCRMKGRQRASISWATIWRVVTCFMALSISVGLAQTPEQQQQRDADDIVSLLKDHHGKGGLTESQCARIASRGRQALPIVLDFLAGRPPFEARFGREAEALRILAAMKDPAALPALRDYVADPKSRSPMLAVRAMLLTQNDAAMRDFVVKTLDEWMVERLPARRQHEFSQWFVPHIVLAPLPKESVLDVATRIHFPNSKMPGFESRGNEFSTMRSYVYYRLALAAADLRSTAVLRAYLASNSHNANEIVAAINNAAKSHHESLDRLKTPTEAPQGGQRGWTEEEWRAFRKKEMAEHQQTVANLESILSGIR